MTIEKRRQYNRQYRNKPENKMRQKAYQATLRSSRTEAQWKHIQEVEKRRRATPEHKAKRALHFQLRGKEARQKRQTPERKAALQKKKSDRWYSDPQFRMTGLLRGRLIKAVRRAGTHKCASALELVGCSAQKLVAYLESLFVPGMTWKNVHVDHRIPCVAFDLNDPEQMLSLFKFATTVYQR